MSLGRSRTNLEKDLQRWTSSGPMGFAVSGLFVVSEEVKVAAGRYTKKSTFLELKVLGVPTTTSPKGEGAPGCWSSRNTGNRIFLVAIELISPANTATYPLILSLRYRLTWFGSTPLNL